MILVVFGGLPGTGKTTVSRLVAAEIGAVHLRIDAIEQAMRNAGIAEPGAAGYAAAQAVAGENLSLGGRVVADCVNPVPVSWQAWREVARLAGSPLLEVEVTCSDPAEHRRRVEERVADLPGHVLPSWARVLGYGYEAWGGVGLVLDTARLSAAAAAERVLDEARRREAAAGMP